MHQVRKLVIVDDFYDDPDKVRSVALSARYTITASPHFDRSSSFINHDVSTIFEKILDIDIKNDINWSTAREVQEGITLYPHNFNGTFYKHSPKIKNLPIYIHHDCHDWVGVHMLSPSCPPEYGTSMWEHIDSQKSFTSDKYKKGHPFDPIVCEPESNWRQTDFIEYKYNRLLIYSGRRFHKVHMNPKVERLGQLFCFNEA